MLFSAGTPQSLPLLGCPLPDLTLPCPAPPLFLSAPAGHEAVLAAWEEVVEPAARRFQPDIIIVSAGYDAHWADPLGGERRERQVQVWGRGRQACASEPHAAVCGRCVAHLSPAAPPWSRPRLPAGLQFCSATYHALAARVKRLADELCGGRLVMLLEGGYDLRALGESVANTFLGEMTAADRCFQLIAASQLIAAFNLLVFDGRGCASQGPAEPARSEPSLLPFSLPFSLQACSARAPQMLSTAPCWERSRWSVCRRS